MKSKLLFKGILSFLLFTIIIYKIDWNHLYGSALRINWLIICLTILFNATGVFISVVKWKLFLEMNGIFQSVRKLQSLYYIGYFFNNFLPSTMGGDFVRIVNTSKNGGFANAFSAVFCERVIGLVTILGFAGIAGVVNLHRNIPIGIRWLATLLIIISGGFVVITIFAISFKSETLKSKYGGSFLSPVFRIVDAIVESLKSPKVLILTFMLSGIFHTLLVVNGYLFARSIGLDIDIIILAVIFPVAMIAAMIPISINGLGVQEGSLMVLLGQIGVPAEDSFIIAMLTRLFIIVGSIIGWMLYMLHKDNIICKVK